jgi:hypothetical protein
LPWNVTGMHPPGVRPSGICGPSPSCHFSSDNMPGVFTQSLPALFTQMLPVFFGRESHLGQSIS